MNYAQIRRYDVANGPGIRTSLFVSGCSHKCKNCFNTAYQDFKYGTPWSKQVEEEFMTIVKSPNVYGITILGGEPLQQTYDHDLKHLLIRIKEETGKGIWIYSGHTFDEIVSDKKKLELLELCDVLVDGRFVDELKNPGLKFKGSSNQNIIDIQKSLINKNPIIIG